METMTNITEDQLGELHETGSASPVVLCAKSAKLPSFVYDRKYGVIACPFGMHPSVKTLLLAWHHGCSNWIDVIDLLKLYDQSAGADLFLTRPGTAFRSSQSKVVEAYSPRNLEDWEIAYFDKVRFIE